MTVKIHALVFRKTEDDNIILSCGALGKNPELLADMLIALRKISEEASTTLGSEEHVKMTFHHFGGYFIFLLMYEDFYVSVFTEPISLDKISEVGEILKFSSEVANLFDNTVWKNLSDEQKLLGIIPESLIAIFERNLANFISSREWSQKINFSEQYVLSRSGINLLYVLYTKLIRRLEKTLGPSLTIMLLERFANVLRDKESAGDLRLIRDRKIRPQLILTDGENLDKALRYLSRVYIFTIKRVKDRLLEDALTELEVIKWNQGIR